MPQQSTEITEVQRAAQEEAAEILAKILRFLVSSPTPEGAEGAEGTGGEYNGPIPNNPAVKGHPAVQAALLDLEKKGPEHMTQLALRCFGHANEWDGGLLNALRSMGYKV
ncbi:hypothetical protein [Nocardia gamkensis]|uniref:Uncharacterized protein n=1 Tax=Nocardia gamkensis TaxID=352869 RepID=A0A7X6L1B3_9NOCA|nr:hypothetical protein [Nocardia gamkensis]NKY25925.1 hypothetical protein [Nocardia gamkensis]NQE68876.1 hypothetical protein [Nocardia gamkensis]